jgi:hypothetical protein
VTPISRPPSIAGKPGKPGQENRDRKTGTGKPGQENRDRKTGTDLFRAKTGTRENRENRDRFILSGNKTGTDLFYRENRDRLTKQGQIYFIEKTGTDLFYRQFAGENRDRFILSAICWNGVDRIASAPVVRFVLENLQRLRNS